MTETQQSTEPSLEADEIQAAVRARLVKYERLNVLEQFAMFMGMAQILEISLKSLLHRKYNLDYEGMDRWTLGRTSRALKENHLRGDFTVLLDSVVGYRNRIAHEFLANEIMLRCLLDGNSGRLEIGELEKGIFELEQIMFLYEWCDRHDAWN